MDVIRSARVGDFANFTARGFDASDWTLAKRERLGINVVGMPGGARNLEALRPAFPWIEHLRVNSATCDDLRLISQMPQLRILAVGGVVKQGLDVSDLPPLESFGGPYKKFPGIETLPSLLSLGVEWRSESAPQITAPLKNLGVAERSANAGLPVIAHPKLLETLEIDFARRIDLTGAMALSALKELTLHGCKVVVGAAELLALTELGYIVLEECPSIEDYEALVSLRDVRVRVIGRNPFGQSFRSEVARRATAEWIFPSASRYTPGGY